MKFFSKKPQIQVQKFKILHEEQFFSQNATGKVACIIDLGPHAKN